MTIFEFLSPIDFWGSLKRAVINVKNWDFYVRRMRQLKQDGSLAQLGMRLDMRSRAYYILNLEPETLMMGSEVLELEKSRVLESINARKGLFEKAELFELIEIKTERIKTQDHYGYLIQIKYLPSSTSWDWFHAISWIAISTTALSYSISYRQPIFDFIKATLN
jgi:hypothetical protein